MEVPIPLDKMSIPDKLRALEAIWSDLQRTPDDVPSPGWHADVLRAREGRVHEDTAQFVDWTEAKQRIRKRTE